MEAGTGNVSVQAGAPIDKSSPEYMERLTAERTAAMAKKKAAAAAGKTRGGLFAKRGSPASIAAQPNASQALLQEIKTLVETSKTELMAKLEEIKSSMPAAAAANAPADNAQEGGKRRSTRGRRRKGTRRH